jgi:hypothetical protein
MFLRGRFRLRRDDLMESDDALIDALVERIF